MINNTGSINLSYSTGRTRAQFTVPMIMEEETMDVERYINDVLPIALKSGNKMLENNWTYQQDGARPHTHHLNQKWCADHFSAFIPKNRWPPYSPDLCPLDYNLTVHSMCVYKRSIEGDTRFDGRGVRLCT